MNLAHRVFLTKHPERLFQINIFAGKNRGGALVGDLLQKIGVGPGNYIFHPREVVFLIGFSKPDDRLTSKGPEIINGQRYLHSTASRTAATNCSSIAIPLSVTSIA